MEGVLYICCLVSKLYCIELCIDYRVVLFQLQVKCSTCGLRWFQLVQRCVYCSVCVIVC